MTRIRGIPEGGLAVGTLLGDSARGGLTGSGALEGSAGGVGGASHGSVGRSRGTGRSAISLVGERIEVLERHLGKTRTGP